MRNRGGFTLLEMVIALGITALLLQIVVFFMVDISEFMFSNRERMVSQKEIRTIERVINQDILNNIDKATGINIDEIIEISENKLSIKHPTNDVISYEISEGNLIRKQGVYVEIIIEKITKLFCEYNEPILSIEIEKDGVINKIEIEVINSFWDYDRGY